ncbi:MAG: peptidase T [Bacteroidota bacterium]
MPHDITYTVLDRFLKYVTIDTESDPTSTTFPSTEKQKNLGRLLVEELQAMGITDAHLDEHGYVYATIPATTQKQVPVLCYCSHMDTSPDCNGKDVKPIVHRNYDGGVLQLPDDPKVQLKPKDHPNLQEQIGNDIVTASGLTLLGADNKAGVAEIMDAAHFFMTHPEVKHGKIRILFTPDEEIGRGVDYVDMEKLGADFGYTVDGEKRGSIEAETFSADALSIDIEGISIHPGVAKGKLESALKIAADIVAALPKDRLSPETTEGKAGYIHPVTMTGATERANIQFILRDFDAQKLTGQAQFLERIVDRIRPNYPNSQIRVAVKEQYRNMQEVLNDYPQVVANAAKAMERVGLTPLHRSIRGGTDGSRLSFMGLPCPNIFAGEHAFHSREEWVSVQDMQKAVDTLIELAIVWEEQTID